MNSSNDLREARRCADRWLTILGYPALALLVYICINPSMLGQLLAVNPFFLLFVVAGIAVLVFLGLAALLNTWRAVRKGLRRDPTEFDPGWAGPLTRYTEADEDDLCGFGVDRDPW
jgi:hypothetical protein